jgi:hypothetical protein
MGGMGGMEVVEVVERVSKVVMVTMKQTGVTGFLRLQHEWGWMLCVVSVRMGSTRLGRIEDFEVVLDRRDVRVPCSRAGASGI